MPAQIVDELDENGQVPATADLSSLHAKPTEQGGQPGPGAEETVLSGDEVPEKYRGKTAAELLQIVRDQESHIGRQGQELGALRGEVGSLRGMVDKALQLRDPGTSREDVGTEEDLVDDQAFITHPRDAVSKTVQRETRGTNERVARLEQQAAAIDFSRRHPTAEQDINDPDFLAFVGKSPKRAQLAQSAFGDTSNIDYDSADELWTLYEDFKSLRAPAEAPAETTETPTDTSAASQPTEPTETRQAPEMVTQGSSGDAGGSNKPVYSQSALNRLQIENPDLYWANDTQNKINEARRDGRVLDDVG